MRITGVLSEFDPVEDIPLMEEDEEIVVRNVGEVIFNPPGDKTYATNICKFLGFIILVHDLLPKVQVLYSH